MPGKTPPTDPDGLTRLKQVVHDLRSPGGCPWDQEQTHESLLSNLLEEAYEAVEAIQSGDREHMREELGDLLLQVVLHGEIASETDAFDLDRIAHGIAEKLIRRHPHVYGDSDVANTAGVLKQWDAIKATEKGSAPASYLAGISRALPSLTRSVKIQKKAGRVGFDWPDAASVLTKVREETDEIAEALASGDAAHTGEEIGDLLFVIANLARKAGHDPEVLLTAANDKFLRRFGAMEQALTAAGTTLDAASQDEMERQWDQVKAAERA